MNPTDNKNIFADTISTRSKFGLRRCFGRDMLNHPEEIALAGGTRFKLVVQVGPKSVREIAEGLFKCGYIDCPKKWIDR